jgi:predicted nuclease with TOPRIM domain
MTDDLTSEIGKLHEHIAHVSHQVRDVKEGQDALHREHVLLRERVDVLERNVSRDIDNLAAHEKEAEIHRGHLLEAFSQVTGAIKSLDTRFEKHAEAEEADRRQVISALKSENFQTRRNGKIDFLWAVGIAVTVGLALFGMLAATGTIS